MKTPLVKTVLRTLTLAGGLCMSMAAWSQTYSTTSFTASYTGSGTSGGACNQTFSINGEAPAASGTYPVFIYLVGTTESYDNASAMAAVHDMASKGYVAASVGYATSLFGGCSVLSGKASCVFNPNRQMSAISQVCSRGDADCSKGIVVAGFSQGSVMATLAKNFDPQVQAVYGMGLSDHYATYGLQACVDNGNRALPSSRLRAVDGESSGFSGPGQSAVQNTLENVTGDKCKPGSYSCLDQKNGSGWVIVKNSQVQDLIADHCYMRVGGCGFNQNDLDAGWENGSDPWEMDPNLQWLTNFTSH